MMAPAALRHPGLRAPAAGLLVAGVVLPLLNHPGTACPLRTATGIPCPLCGMSTSVQATVRGRWTDALGANPMGLVLVVAALAVLVGLRIDVSRLPRSVIVVGLAAMWLFQLQRFALL